MKDAIWVGPLTVFVMVGTFFSAGGEHGLTGWQWVSVVLAGLACLSLVLARRSPERSIVLAGALVGGFFAGGFADGPVYLPVLLGGFVVARAAPVHRWLPWFGVAVGLVLAGMAVRAVTTELGWWQPLGQSIGVTALASTAAAIGSLVRSRQQTERERRARAATEEQLRMAQDLHDGVGHGLAVIAMQAGVALHVLERDPAAARSALEAIREASKESLDSLRTELSRLSGASPRAHRRGLADLGVLVDRVRAAGLEVDLRRAGDPGGFPAPDVDAAAYAIVQEALTNVLRHAAARRVVVDVSVGERVTLSVADNGRGGAVHAEGMGLRGMRERVEALGGTMVAGPRAGSGFEVTASLPLTGSAP